MTQPKKHWVKGKLKIEIRKYPVWNYYEKPYQHLFMKNLINFSALRKIVTLNVYIRKQKLSKFNAINSVL